MLDDPSPIGRCWDCNYNLRGIDSRRCPECGRAFDPADPASFNPGESMGALARRMVRPIGWWWVVLLLIATIGIVVGTGLPHDWGGWFEDLPLIRYCRENPVVWTKLTWRAKLYAGSVAAMLLVVLGMALRIVARWGVVLRYRRHGLRLARRPRRALAAMVMVVIAMAWIAKGGEKRIGHEFAYDASVQRGEFGFDIEYQPREKCRETATAREMVLHGNAKERRAGFAYFMELQSLYWLGDDGGIQNERVSVTLEAYGNVVLAALARERDADMIVFDLHLLGVLRDEEASAVIEGYLNHPRPEIRAAAIDALGIIHQPAWPLGKNNWRDIPPAVWLTGSPRISIDDILEGQDGDGQEAESRSYSRRIPMSAELRRRLEAVMLGDVSQLEREAAARALLQQPPDGYRLRIAEWGVWADQASAPTSMQNPTADVPPFVHRTANSLNEIFGGRQRLYTGSIFKPVVHITSSVPLSVDLQAGFGLGRPWVAYPAFDDFELRSEGELHLAPGTTRPVYQLAPLERPALGGVRYADLRSGYPWLGPAHEIFRISHQISLLPDDFSRVGVHWQSLIVSPTKLPWIKEAPVPIEKKYAWWNRLRQVDCSWVWSRGEAERFVYYDGGTMLRLPYSTHRDGQTLHFVPIGEILESRHRRENLRALLVCPDGEPVETEPSPLESQSSTTLDATAATPPPWALLVEVRHGAARGQVIFPGEGEQRMFDDPTVELRGEQVYQCLRQAVLERGLKPQEADAFLDCWRKDFFENDGCRLLTLASRGTYDALCPMTVRPAPTECVRVGLFVTDLDKAPPSPATLPAEDDGSPNEWTFAARPFNSKLALQIWANHDSFSPPQAINSLGHTPALHPLVIPASFIWGVTPGKDMSLEAVAAEMRSRPIPGMVLPEATDADLAHIRDLPELRMLELGKTAVTDKGLKQLKGLTGLWWLGLASTKVTDAGLEILEGMKDLETLKLGETAVTDEGLTHLMGLHQLQSLDLTDATRVTDKGLKCLKQLKRLRTLYLTGTGVTDGGLQYLKDLPDLQEAHFENTKVTRERAAMLKKALPNCDIVDGYGARF